MSSGFTLVSRKRRSVVVSAPSFGTAPKLIGVSHVGLTNPDLAGAPGGGGSSVVPSASSRRGRRRRPTGHILSKLGMLGPRDVKSSAVPKYAAPLWSRSPHGPRGAPGHPPRASEPCDP